LETVGNTTAPAGAVVAVTGAAGAIGTRLVELLLTANGPATVRAIDRVEISERPGLKVVQLDLATDELDSAFMGVSTVVHLATASTPRVDEMANAQGELEILDRVLAASAAAEVTHLVVLSTAMVYGAWPGNPVPLTESAPIRPNPDFPWAATRARVERRCQEWGREHGVSVAVLRPTAVVADGLLGDLARALDSARQGIAADGDPPVQYLHIDDLVSAVATVVGAAFSGVANIAPDGWIPPGALAELEGPRQRLRAPMWVVGQLAEVRSRYGLAPISAGVLPYTASSWVVANDQIRSLGWDASYSNEEAWVVSHEPHALERLPARKRQELALAAMVVAGLGAGSALIAAIRRWSRRLT